VVVPVLPFGLGGSWVAPNRIDSDTVRLLSLSLCTVYTIWDGTAEEHQRNDGAVPRILTP
jgi:hypothetical protein